MSMSDYTIEQILHALSQVLHIICKLYKIYLYLLSSKAEQTGKLCFHPLVLSSEVLLIHNDFKGKFVRKEAEGIFLIKVSVQLHFTYENQDNKIFLFSGQS